MNDAPTIICIAIPAPIYGTFDYLPAEDFSIKLHSPGKRVLVTFGKRELIGLVTETKIGSSAPQNKLKKIIKLFDDTTAIPDNILSLLHWCATYYCHPIGDCIQSALPSALRRSGEAKEIVLTQWQRTDKPFQGRSNALKQQKTLNSFVEHPGGILQSELISMGFQASQLRALEQLGYLTHCDLDPLSVTEMHLPKALQIDLNEGQKNADLALSSSLGEFKISLLQGVTGSGKTEVYIKLVARILKKGKQALVLVPEINLTPQTLARFQSQLATPITAIHSGMSEREKFTAWSLAKRGKAKVIIGTRSAIFTPFKALGIIIVDEEHDASYKQIDGFKYSARDLAVKRAQIENCNVILGSATPSLESIQNARQQKYHRVKIERRVGVAEKPEVSLIDIRSRPLQNGCSQPLIESIGEEIIKGNQVIIFQNRRGFSPTLMCTECGTLVHCHQCDAKLTVHSKPPHLCCHHCNYKRAIPRVCEQCGEPRLSPVGVGTERLEHALAGLFPDTQIIRIDRDSIKQHKHMEQLIEQINQGHSCLLIGTQMLAKGHDFHNVTLVAVVDADASFFSSDFRAIERGAQQLLQVAGRTGRGTKKGRVLIQTRQAEHPLFDAIIESDYDTIASTELADREACGLPPFSKMVSIRADAKTQVQTTRALEKLHQGILARMPMNTNLHISGPITANISRKSGMYRSYLHLFFTDTKLRAFILSFLPSLIHVKQAKLTVDVDPSEYI